MERSKIFRRRIDAEGFLTSTEGAKLRGEWVDPRRSKVAFEEWADRWLATTVHLKPKTRAGYESLLRTQVLPEFGKLPLNGIEPEQVSAWVAHMAERGLSASRIRQAYRVLSAALKAAVLSRYISNTPCIGVRLPRPRRREMHFLLAAQVQVLSEAVPEPYDALVDLLAYGGIRWGEAVALRRGRCDLLRSRIEISESLAEVGGKLYFGPSKTYETRTVRLPAFLREMLAQHLAIWVEPDPSALVFTRPDGQVLRHWWFWNRVWTPSLGAAKLPSDLRIHDLRHTCAALLISQGAHPKAIQTHLGHSTIQVTMDRYGHLFPDEMDRLADGLDAVHRLASMAPTTAHEFRATKGDRKSRVLFPLTAFPRR